MIHNLFLFHGADHKVGTTMISQSVAESITANHPNLKILFIAMNGRESAEYVREVPAGIDGIKFHMDNKMVNGKDFLKTCTHKGSFYMMAGISNETEARYYHPDMAVYLLEEVAPEFDLIIADGGNELDNGLALGALTVAGEIFLVAAQQESALRGLEKNIRAFDELGFRISKYIVNKYCEQEAYSLSYIANRMGIAKERLVKVGSAPYSLQAEMDCKTLLEYKNEAYRRDIAVLANEILNKSGYDEIKRQRKSRWKSFI